MSEHACVAFMQWALPRLGMRWRGFRRVRRQVCRRIRWRMKTLGLNSYDAYRAFLEATPDEWRELDHACRVTISRFNRNRRVFEQLPRLLEQLAASAPERPVRVWSAGCASGEEPYSVLLAAENASLPHGVDVVATDRDSQMLERARRGRYPRGSLRELPDAVVGRWFTREDDELVLSPEITARVAFLRQDVRTQAPSGSFDLILCRNLAFTYFDEPNQRRVAQRFAERSSDAAALIVGSHETLPDTESWELRDGVYFKR